MSKHNDSKEYDSIFVPKLKIPVSAFITEAIIENKIKWRAKSGAEIAKPLVPFWRKSVVKENPGLKQLSEEYCLEISYVQNLLKVFSAQNILSYVKDRGIVTFRFLPLDKQKTVIYNLYQNEIELSKEKEEVKKVTLPPDNLFSRKSKKDSLI